MQPSGTNRFFSWLTGHNSPQWKCSAIFKTTDEEFAGKTVDIEHPDIGIAHGSTFFEGENSIATDQALVQEHHSKGQSRIHVIIADGFGHPPQEEELRTVSREAKETLSFAALSSLKDLDSYRKHVGEKLQGLCREAGNPMSCRFAYGSCLIESLAWRANQIAHVRFAGLGDSIGIVINAHRKVLYYTPVGEERDHLSVAFNQATIEDRGEKHAFFVEKEFNEQVIFAITASDALLDAFSEERIFNKAEFEKTLRACTDLAPKKLATHLYEKVEESVKRSVDSVEKGQRIPFAGDDTTIIVTRI